MRVFALIEGQFAGIMLVATLLVCAGCGEGCNDSSPGPLIKDTQVVVLASRNLETGRFEAFEIRDKAMIEQAKSALMQDLRHPDQHSKSGLGMSVNHVLAFCSADGETAVYELLGDQFILSNSTRYPAQQTIAVLKAAKSQGKAVAITSEQARHLAPDLGGYLE